MGVGSTFARIDPKKVEKVLSQPWAADGSNFSERIWKSRTQLVNELNNQLSQALIRGQNPKALTDAIAHKFKVSKAQAGRLVMTETAFFHSAAQRDSFNALNVKKYKIVATLDDSTSDICQSMDGEVTPMSEYKPGVTAPPFHVWCRSTTVPYFEDEDGERAARDKDGNTYYVPADMTYPEWYKKFVANSSGSDKLELTYDELRALNNYISSASYTINEILRTDGYNSLSSTQKDIVDNLDTALKKLPTYKGNISRSLEFIDDNAVNEFISKFEIGSNIVFDEYISTTSATKLYNPNGQVQIFIMNSKKGRDITTFNASEAEVLYERGSEFKILNVDYRYDKYWILLEEAQ